VGTELLGAQFAQLIHVAENMGGPLTLAGMTARCWCQKTSKTFLRGASQTVVWNG